MNDQRVNRLSHRLLAALEDFYVDDTPPDKWPTENRRREREFKVVKSEKTREKLERWFLKRNIPIRIIYSYTDLYDEKTKKYKPNISPIGKQGIITFYYAPVGQEPPTAWIIVHNLSHAIYEIRVYNPESPYEVLEEEQYKPSGSEEDKRSYPAQWEKAHNLMGRDPKRDPIYPTTRSYRNDQIETAGEAFHELFTQWVVKGKVILDPRNPKLEERLAYDFRNRIDYLADMGAVVYNV